MRPETQVELIRRWALSELEWARKWPTPPLGEVERQARAGSARVVLDILDGRTHVEALEERVNEA